jgi:hypothetical protein
VSTTTGDLDPNTTTTSLGVDGGDGTGAASQSGTPPVTGEEEQTPKTFTQEEVNAIAAREAAKAARGKLDPKELGFDSAKDMKEFFESAKAKQEADKDEDEKALEQAVKEAREEATSTVLASANQRVLKSEFTLAAMQHEVEPGAMGDAFTLAKTMDIWSGVEIDGEGAVTGFDDNFFVELKKAKPFLFKQAPVGGGAGAGGAAPSGGKTNEDQELAAKYPALQDSWRMARMAEVYLNAGGSVIPSGTAAGQGAVGVICVPGTIVAGDIVSVLRHGEIVEFGGTVSGTYYAGTGGVLSTTTTNATQVGFTVEADRLIVAM